MNFITNLVKTISLKRAKSSTLISANAIQNVPFIKMKDFVRNVATFRNNSLKKTWLGTRKKVDQNSNSNASVNSNTYSNSNSNLNDSGGLSEKKDRVYWYNDSYLLLSRLEKLISIIESNNESNSKRIRIPLDINHNHNSDSKNEIDDKKNETLDTDAVNMITDLVKRHVISREIHFAFVLSKYLKYPNLLKEAIILYQLFKEKKLRFKDKNLTTFWTGCIDHVNAIDQQRKSSSQEAQQLDSAFTDMVHDSWIYHTTAPSNNIKKQRINAIHVATYLSLLSWMECTDFKRIDSVYQNLPKYNLDGTSSPQHYVYALSSYMKASTKCLKAINIQEINSDGEADEKMIKSHPSTAPSALNASNDFEAKLQIIQKVSKEIHKTYSQGITIDSKIVAQYLQMLLFFDKINFSSKSKTKKVKTAQMAHHELILKEITFFTGLSSPTIQNTRAKSKQTPLSPSTLLFQRFNDSYQLANCIMDIEERIRRSHTFPYLSDRQFGESWYKMMVVEFPHDSMNGSDSSISQKYKSILAKKVKQFK